MKKTIAWLLVILLCAALFAACDGTATETPEPTEEPGPQTDEEKAAYVGGLIDAIYVQERTEDTDAQCLAAKEAWDALTEEQKELVSGEYADPDYFGLDTGDASKDDPLNADGIGENELLVVSFGTSFNDSRAMDIGGVEAALKEAFPDWSVRRAFTSQIIINHIQARDGEAIDNVDQALARAVKNGVKNLVIQPTHLMHGAEYDELAAAAEQYRGRFESLTVAEPLLGEMDESTKAVNSDKEAVAVAVAAQAAAEAGYPGQKEAQEDGTAFVFMGRGTSHKAKVTYTQMQEQMNKLGYANVFIGTVEGEPEETACDAVIEEANHAGYANIILRPLMVVAGDHANNDMAGGDEDSWLSMFTDSGLFEDIQCQIAGLGRIPDIQKIYVSHAKAAILSSSRAGETDEEAGARVGALIDAIYVQERTEETDTQCSAAKAAWDALTDEQKALVTGEHADPDYFGLDTGDASKDDPLNADGIGENELLVVSFGTSFNDSRVQDIGGIEVALAAAFPDFSVRRAFTSQIIINHIQARDGEYIDNVEQAIVRAVRNGVKNLVIQPTHLMRGAEYDELAATVEAYREYFETVTIAGPLLGETGANKDSVNRDKRRVAEALTAEALAESGYTSLSQAEKAKTAFVFMGHGTSHTAKITYSQMQAQLAALKYKNVFIGTVEGEPEDTACEKVIEAVHAAGYKHVVLRPLMVVAGDHANNDMAGADDDSWLNLFLDSGYFESVDCQILGLGRIPKIQQLYVEHANTAARGVVQLEETDEEAAARVAALIDAIYVQQRTDETDALCRAARAAWDALTDEQKEMVEGEYADPDYFGRDTGSPILDDPLNADDIGENEILAVSFGTSYNDSRAADIGGIEAALRDAYPDWSVRRAFTSQIIINHILARDGEAIDNVEQALDRAVKNGVKNLIVQPTHLMHGAEYDELMAVVERYRDRFETVSVAEPLLGEVGAEAETVNSDKEAVAAALTAAALEEARYDTIQEAEEDGTAFVFLGHGTSHTAKITYTQMQAQMRALGYSNVFIGTVEGEPEGTSCEDIIRAVQSTGYRNVILRPMMVVAGDHANNDMAGDDEDSWMSLFVDSGFFEKVGTQIDGLGRIEDIQKLYVAHTADAIAKAGPKETTEPGEQAAPAAEGALADGVYEAEFHTDSTMFHVNESKNGLGILTVKDGKMTIHVSLVSQSITNLFVGKADDPDKDNEKLLMPTFDEVTYADGTKEEVFGFDIPVLAIGEEFDLAIIGTKGVWYDHKVSVTNPVPVQ